MRKVVMLAAAVAATLAAGVGSASAAGPAPGTGLPGAWNMLHDPTMLPGTGGAMDKDNINGNIGMCTAGLVSSGVGC